MTAINPNAHDHQPSRHSPEAKRDDTHHPANRVAQTLRDLVTFNQEVDEHVKQNREKRPSRLLLGLDLKLF